MARTEPTTLAIIRHSGVFDRTVVTPYARGGTTVSYWLDSRGLDDVVGPYTFYLEWAESPDAKFIEVAGPTAGGILVDPSVRRFSTLPHSVYRVRLEAVGSTHYSDPVYESGNLNRHDYTLAREIVRREYLALTRYTGTQGVYLARKQWGELCPVCLDFDTGMVNNADCAVCYGTGFVGGYHTPSTMWLGEGRLGVDTARKDGVGMVSNQKQVVRAVACPFLTSDDIWVNTSTDERWFIGAKTEVASYRGKPLVYAVEILLIPPDDIAYTIPLTPVESSSSF